MKAFLIVLVAAAVFVPAAAAAPPRVIAHSSSSGEIAITAVNGSKDNATALFMRGYGDRLMGRAIVACSRGVASVGTKSTTLPDMKAGQLYRLKLPFRGGDCQITGSLSGKGRIRLQLLG